MEVFNARPLRNEEARNEEGRQENPRRHDGEDEEEKGDEEKALMKNTKSGRAQARRVRTQLKPTALTSDTAVEVALLRHDAFAANPAFFDPRSIKRQMVTNSRKGWCGFRVAPCRLFGVPSIYVQ